jgi:tetratricopeptide (TPR) repeat protein
LLNWSARRALMLFAVLTLIVGPTPAALEAAASAAKGSHGEHGAKAAREGAPLFGDLGDHHHPIKTKSKEAQKYFDQGLTLAYAFNHPEAGRSFREAARLDPDCAMAWWGVALVLGPNINKPMAEEDAPKAWEALRKARELARTASEKERAYIAALSKRYAEDPPEDRSGLDKAYADAMREVAQRYPDDLDAATLFAEALMDTMPWQYWTKESQPKAETKEILAALEGVLERKPDHPGACHYYIHAVEAVAPERALAAADTLRRLVPGAGHLVHMPAHIYLRLGLYREATLVNELASQADESYIAQCNAQGFYPAAYYPHNVHFLWYTNAMEGRSSASMEAARTIADHGEHMALAEAERLRPLLSMVLVRFGQWDEVLKQPKPSSDRVYETAMWHYVQGLASAAKGQVQQAERHLGELKRVASSDETKSLDTDILPGASLIAISVHDLAGHVALKKDEHEQAVDELRKAVELEDQLPYMEPPFCYMPMRHGLGAALLAAGKAQEAEKVYREDLVRHPHNGWSLYGLAKSLRAQGKDELADEVMKRFDLAWVRADVKITSSRF